jgi:hypothetical protein
MTDTITRVIFTDCYYGYRYIVPSRYRNDFMATEDERWNVLASIGIERREGLSPLQAWRDAVADESGIDRAIVDPATGRGLDLCFSETPVRQFVMYLA